MCGNQLSTIEQPMLNTEFYEKIRKQVPTGKVYIKDHKITSSDILLFSRLQTFSLRQMDLIKCDIQHQILEQLLKCDFSSLERLNLSDNRIGPIGCRHIASCDTLSNLKSLEINNNKIKDNGLKAIALGTYKNLEDISLNDNGLTSNSFESLANFINLEYISVSGNFFGDQDLKAILKANPSGFVFLGLSRNKFTQAVFVELMKLKSLQVLLIDRNNIKKDLSKMKVREDIFIFS